MVTKVSKSLLYELIDALKEFVDSIKTIDEFKRKWGEQDLIVSPIHTTLLDVNIDVDGISTSAHESQVFLLGFVIKRGEPKLAVVSMNRALYDKYAIDSDIDSLYAFTRQQYTVRFVSHAGIKELFTKNIHKIKRLLSLLPSLMIDMCKDYQLLSGRGIGQLSHMVANYKARCYKILQQWT